MDHLYRSPAATVVVAIGAGLLVLALGLAALGHSPIEAFGALARGAFGSWYAISSATLVRAIPLIVLGLGFALAFRGGAFNIGMEGQFLVGAIAATWAGIRVTGLPGPAAWLLVLGSGAVAGALWVVVPVVLRLRLGVLEVITTLLLNFVAEALVSWMVQGPLQERNRFYPQSDPIAAAARLPVIPGTRLHLGFLLAILLAGVLAVVFARTVWGFRLKAVGLGPRAAAVSGRIDAGRLLAVALLLSGAIAGLGGALEVSGVSYALYQNLSPGYGFTAIAVALLARGRPLGIVAAGILFGALEAGAGAMQREAGIPSVAVYVAQATIILVVLLAEVVGRRRQALAVFVEPEEEAA
ncbi:MAG: ABC transporter permease [Gemmatimonadota bacterium]